MIRLRWVVSLLILMSQLAGCSELPLPFLRSRLELVWRYETAENVVRVLTPTGLQQVVLQTHTDTTSRLLYLARTGEAVRQEDLPGPLYRWAPDFAWLVVGAKDSSPEQGTIVLNKELTRVAEVKAPWQLIYPVADGKQLFTAGQYLSLRNLDGTGLWSGSGSATSSLLHAGTEFIAYDSYAVNSYDLKSDKGTELFRIRKGDPFIGTAGASADGQTIAIVVGRVVTILDRTGRVLGEYRSERYMGDVIGLSPDGQRVLISGFRLLDQTGRVLAEAGRKESCGAYMSPDANYIVTVCAALPPEGDRWQIRDRDGRLLLEQPVPKEIAQSKVVRYAVSAEMGLMVVSHDGMISAWKLPPLRR